MPGADQRDDRGRLHEVEVPMPAGEQAPQAEAERRAGAERDERVHVRAAAFELAPGAAEKPPTAHGHHRRGQGETDPFEGVTRAPAEDPFADDERQRKRGSKNHGELQVSSAEPGGPSAWQQAASTGEAS